MTNDNDPVLYWKLDAPPGGPHDKTIPDSSGHGHDGELQQGAKIVADGAFGNCLQCAHDGDHVGAAGLGIELNTAFTLEIWLNPDASAEQAYPVDGKNFLVDVGQLLPELWMYVPDKWSFVGDTSLSVGQWSHLAFTYDGKAANSNVKLYVNGGDPYSSPPHPGTLATLDDLAVGCRITAESPGVVFAGKMAHFRIYDRVLTQEEIQADLRSDAAFVKLAEAAVPTDKLPFAQTGAKSAGLYQAAGATPAESNLYCLVYDHLKFPGLPDYLSELASWIRAAAYVFTPTVPPDKQKFLDTLLGQPELLPARRAGVDFRIPRLVWWLPKNHPAQPWSEDKYRAVWVSWAPPPQASLPKAFDTVRCKFQIGRMWVYLDTTQPDPPGVSWTPGPSGQLGQVSIENTAIALRYQPAWAKAAGDEDPSNSVSRPLTGPIGVLLSGPDAGILEFKAQLFQDETQGEFGAELRCCVTPQGKSDVQVRTYPFLREEKLTDYAKDEHVLAFDVRWDPLYPLDDGRTRFVLDQTLIGKTEPFEETGGKIYINDLSIPFFFSTSGAEVSLAPSSTPPQDLPGFAFAKSKLVVRWSKQNKPVPFTTQQDDWYLAPAGAYKGAAVNGGKQLMGGTAGTEYLLVVADTVLHFATGADAYVENIDLSGKTPGAVTPTGDYTGVRVQLAGTAPTNGTVGTGYCVQPAAAVQYHVADSETKYPPAGAWLGNPAGVPVPLMPYAGIYTKQRVHELQPLADSPTPNQAAPAADFAVLEELVWAPLRWRTYVTALLVARAPGPLAFDTDSRNLYLGGGVRTPIGFLTDLLKTGTVGAWAKLMLAQSPIEPGEQLSIAGATAADPIPPLPGYALTDDHLFLAVTNGDDLGQLSSKVQLGDFTFEVDLGGKNTSILLFKFATGLSVKQLVAETALWTNGLLPKQSGGRIAFLNADESLDSVQGRLKKRIQEAETGATAGEQIFDDFVRLVKNPDWTGVLVMNCGLDLHALPTDIKMLLGGIQGTLRAHHFGVAANRIAGDVVPPALDQSSLFGVVHYQDKHYPNDPFPTKQWQTPFYYQGKEYPDVSPWQKDFPYAFAVMLLEAQYENSKLVRFHSEIAMRISEIFGNPVTLSGQGTFPKSDAIAIKGRYLRHPDGTGELIFDTKTPRLFTIDAPPTRTLTTMAVSDATLVPVGESKGDVDPLNVYSAFKLSGDLSFTTWPGGGYDLFSFGDVDPHKGLAFSGYAIDMTTQVPKSDTQPSKITCYKRDLTHLRVDAAASTARAGSLAASFPTRIDAIRSLPAGLDTGRRGVWPVTVGTTASSGKPLFTLDFHLLAGTPGALVSKAGNMQTYLLAGWSPGGADNPDTAACYLALPAAAATSRGLRLQGFVDSTFTGVTLTREPRGTTGKFLYALQLAQFQSKLLNVPIDLDENGPKTLTLFGNPDAPAEGNAVWHLADQPALLAAENAAPAKAKKNPKNLQWYLGRSTAIHTTVTQTAVIDKALKKLFKHRSGLKKMIEGLVKGDPAFDDGAGLTFGLKLGFPLKLKTPTVLVEMLLQDDDFYGARVQLKPNKNTPLGKALAAKGIKEIDLEVIYRKINDHLGAFSADLYINVGKIKVGNAQLVLPSVSLVIYTNGDWRVAIGWPLKRHPFILYIQVGELPVVAKAGLYLAKLRSADAPKPFHGEGVEQFDLIWSFGLELRAGLGKSYKKGPLAVKASLTAGGTFQGFLASKDGQMTEDGVDYMWFAITLSITLSLKASLRLPLITASLSLVATIGGKLALETAHSTHLMLYASVRFNLSVKVVLVHIHIHFHARVKLVDTSFGSGKPASFAYPDPPKSVTARSAAPMEQTLARAAMAGPPAPQPIELYFVLQTTATSATWTPQVVATLCVLPDDFQAMAEATAGWLLDTYRGYKPPTPTTLEGQWQNVVQALDDGVFDTKVDTCLNALFTFEVSGVDLTDQSQKKIFDGKTVAAFPFPDQLSLTYNGQPHDSKIAQPGYLAALAKAFGEKPPAHPLTAATSVRTLVLREYFLVLAGHLAGELTPYTRQKTANKPTYPTLAEVLAAWVTGTGNLTGPANLTGFVSRFLLGGARAPDPDKLTTLEGLYQVTGQQFAFETNVYAAEVAAKPGDLKLTVKSGKAQLDKSQIPTKPTQLTKPTPASLGSLRQAPEVMALNHSSTWGTQRILRFTTAVQHLVEERLTAGDLVYLKLGELPGSGDHSPLDLFSQVTADQLTAWPGTPSVLLPVLLRQVPKPGSPGNYLDQVYELVGMGEADRAYLQALLDALGKGAATIDSLNLNLLQQDGSGGFKTIATPPEALIKTDLSTSVLATGGQGSDSAAWADQDKKTVLRLMWECSVTHSHGFYFYFSSDQSALFSDGEATLLLVVETAAAAAAILKVGAYTNAVTGTAPAEGSAVVAGLCSDSQGIPVQSWHPTFPGGEVAWSMERKPPAGNTASSDDLDNLYHLAVFKVTQAGGQAPKTHADWSRPIAPRSIYDETGEKVIDWRWEHTLETAPLVAAPNRYALVSKEVAIDVLMADIFGNLLPETEVGAASLEQIYHDELVDVAHWPGVSSAYEVNPALTGVKVPGANLRVQLSFDSQEWKDASADEKAGAIDRWSLIYDQLTAAQPAVPSLATVLDPGLDSASLAGAVKTFAGQVLTFLENSTPVPTDLVKDFLLDRSVPSGWKTDLQEIGVDFVLTRTVTADIAKKLPAAAKVSTPMKPYMETASPSMRSFAQKFEKAYYQYDGAGGQLKVASGVDSRLNSSTFGHPTVWATRWRGTKGIQIEVHNDGTTDVPGYWAPPPLSTTLISGSATVTTYAKFPETNPPQKQRFSGVELDKWGREFLSDIERLFSPELSPAIWDLDKGTTYETAAGRKRSLSADVAGTVGSVYTDDAGDQKAAGDGMHEAMLESLERDYGTSVIAQFQADVTLGASAEEAPPPNLFGSPAAGTTALDHAYSFSPCKLPLAASPPTSWLTTLISARTPAASRFLCAKTLEYNIGFLEHDILEEKAKYGYVPSSWLAFVLTKDLWPDPAPQNTLTVPLGKSAVPIPLRSFPPMPQLKSQAAAQSYLPTKIDTIGKALLWNYSLSVGLPSADQDTLVLMVNFNEKLESVDRAAEVGVGQETGVEELFEALAAYWVEAPVLEQHLKPEDPNLKDAVAQLNTLAGKVATAWAKWQGQPAPEPPAGAWTFRIEGIYDDPKSLKVAIVASSQPPDDLWPVIKELPNTTAAKPETDSAGQVVAWYKRYSSAAAKPTTIDLSWSDLFVLGKQSAVTSAYVERNADLGKTKQCDQSLAERTVNPDFIYRTPVLHFMAPVVPLIQADPEPPLEVKAGAHLADALTTLLQDLRTPYPTTNPAQEELALETAIGYGQALIVKSENDKLVTERPVFLVDEDVQPDPKAAQTTATALAQALSKWRQDHHAGGQDVVLSFFVTLFATKINLGKEPLPLVRITRIEIKASSAAGWWPPPPHQIGAPLPGPGPSSEGELRCPKDGGGLTRFEREAMHMERCQTCGGLWFDHGELAALLGEHVRIHIPAWARDTGLSCPRCAGVLAAHHLPEDGVPMDQWSVEIDQCRSCQGIWLDAAELEKIQQTRKPRGVKGLLKKLLG